VPLSVRSTLLLELEGAPAELHELSLRLGLLPLASSLLGSEDRQLRAVSFRNLLVLLLPVLFSAQALAKTLHLTLPLPDGRLALSSVATLLLQLLGCLPQLLLDALTLPSLLLQLLVPRLALGTLGFQAPGQLLDVATDTAQLLL